MTTTNPVLHVEDCLRQVSNSLHLSSESLSHFGASLFALVSNSEGATPPKPLDPQEPSVNQQVVQVVCQRIQNEFFVYHVIMSVEFTKNANPPNI